MIQPQRKSIGSKPESDLRAMVDGKEIFSVNMLRNYVEPAKVLVKETLAIES